jgi:cytoskeletal protein CcmA (bactofilin family)
MNPADGREQRMADSKRRRLMDTIGESPSFVAEGVRITGDVETPGPLVVCGWVRGDGKVQGTLRMSVTAQWEGEIRCEAAIVAGRITGRLVVEHKLEVGSSAVIRADIVAGSIAIAKGAVIDGSVTATSGERVVEFEEKRR